jgi:hypothetical protein
MLWSGPKWLTLTVNFCKQSGAQVFAVDLAPFQAEMATGQRRKLEEAFAGVTHAVHLIGSIAPAKAENFSQLHQEQSRAFASWCVRAQRRWWFCSGCHGHCSRC